MKWCIGLLLMAGVLSGCSKEYFAEFFATRLGSETRHTITCHCSQEQAATYAAQAVIDLGSTPVFNQPASLSAVCSNADGFTVTKLNVVIKPLETSTSEILVRTESSSTEGTDARAAEAFVVAFGKAAQ
jgi:hypothetical protein